MKKIVSLVMIASLLTVLSVSAGPLPSHGAQDSSLQKESRRPVVFEQTDPAPREKKRSPLPIILGVLAAGAIVAAVLILTKEKDQEKKEEEQVITPPVFRQGQFTVRGTYFGDLDLGQESAQSGADFWWEQVGSGVRYLVPENGAKFFVVGSVNFDNITYQQLKGYAYSADRINGSDGSANKIPSGTVVAAITNEGRYCKFRIDSIGFSLTLTFLTYEKQ